MDVIVQDSALRKFLLSPFQTSYHFQTEPLAGSRFYPEGTDLFQEPLCLSSEALLWFKPFDDR